MSNIESQWAWSQVEAAADGTLSPAERRRMRDAMARDDALRKAVERAASLRRSLRGLRADPVPLSLAQRLLRIPRDARPARGRRATTVALVAGLGLAAATVIVAIALLTPAPQTRDPTLDAQDRAVAEFGVAMTYLRHSVTIAENESTAAVRGALVADARAADRPRSEPRNGE